MTFIVPDMISEEKVTLVDVVEKKLRGHGCS